MRKPNFLIVGTQKSGTTFLYKNLQRHQDVFMSRDKEPHFFDKPNVNSETVSSYLKKHFSKVDGESLVGEASALYLHSYSVPALLEEHLGQEIKIIICLRKPIEKAISLYMHDYRKGRLLGNEPLCYVLPDGLCPSYDRSRYASYCTEYISRFGHDNVKILFFEDLVQNPLKFLSETCNFLGVSCEQDSLLGKVNPGLNLVREGDFITISPEEEIPKGTEIPRIHVSEINDLNSRLHDDIDILSRITERDLSAWHENL